MRKEGLNRSFHGPREVRAQLAEAGPMLEAVDGDRAHAGEFEFPALFQIRENAFGPGFYNVDPARDTSLLITYSYDGEAEAIEFLSPPRTMLNAPCRTELAQELKRLGVSLPSSPGGPGWAPTVSAFPATRNVQTTQQGMYIRLRDVSQVSYVQDITGDGTETVEFTEDGSAIGIRLWDYHLGVFTSELPCKHEVREMLQRFGVPLADGPSLEIVRPQLESLQVPSFIRISLARGERVRDWDLHGNGLVNVELQADGMPVAVTFRDTTLGVNIGDVPYQDCVAAILLHQGVPVTDSKPH